MRYTPSKPIKLGDDERITFASVIDRGLELRPRR